MSILPTRKWNKVILLFFSLLSVVNSFSLSAQIVQQKVYQDQDLPFAIKLIEQNPKDQINDGSIRVCVLKAGKDSLFFCWSFQDYTLTDTLLTKIPEGIPYKLVVFNNKGDSLAISSQIPTQSPSEKLNATISPIVDFVQNIFFWDLFAALNLYDPIIYDAQGHAVLYPNGEVKKTKIPFLVIWLIIGALFFTIRTKFINIRGVKYAYLLLKNEGKKETDKEEGEVSHFQALTTALSATVGLGNIAGVAVAISLGGPGAVFWMVAAGFLGMSSKFVECTLGVKYRSIKNGIVSGGPMYYLSKGLAQKGYVKLGKVLAIIFAVLCVGGSFGGGNMFQANQASSQFMQSFQSYTGGGFYVGLVLAFFVAIVIVGGIKKIAKVTDKIVPFMCLLYVLAAIVVIVLKIEFFPLAIKKIFYGAFATDALKGGVIGVIIQGFQRAAFSNEAGVGSASIAHAAVKTKEPISEGLVALLEPLIDTIIVCSLTALVIIFTGFDETLNAGELSGAALTSQAFASVFPFAQHILLVVIILFAFSTMISWSYYGLKSWEYLFGDRKFSEYTYKIIFLIFVVIGASIDLGAVIDFSDLMILGMAFPNIIGLYFLLPEVKMELKKYVEKYIKN